MDTASPGILLLLSLALTLAPSDARAQAVVRGTVVDEVGAALEGVEVRAEGAAPVVTDRQGRYRLRPAAPGRVTLQFRRIGYEPLRRSVDVPAEGAVDLDVTLTPGVIALNPLVVTGTMKETRVADSPVKVEVVSARMLQRDASFNLMESLGHINGLYTQVDCAVCYTNNIRINGMEGPYTAVLIDGMPIMGALASVYGLNGIDPSIIERLEILKGPQSTLYGTEAMGGVVNVITKDARFAPRWSVDASRSSFGENGVNVAAAPGAGGRTLLSGSWVHNDRFIDGNGDGFSDVTMDTRLSLFARTAFGGRTLGRDAFTLTAKAYREDRFGGVEAWTEEDRGSDEVYGESIRTTRFELMGRAVTPWPSVRADASWSWHDQDSFYGDQPYRATQQVAYGQLLWDRPARSRHDVLVGLGLRASLYDDDTPATRTADLRLIPGLFAQDEVDLGRWTLLGGLRADHHAEHGFILSPRASVRWSPRPETTLRLNAGTGFRVVNLFAEDHAALTGARTVVVEEDLEPERSWSVAFNLNQVFAFGLDPMMVDVDVFHTRFGNRIVPDYDTDPDLILYRNLDGRGVSRGFSLSLNQNFATLPLFYTLGLTVQDVELERGGLVEDETFSADWKGVWTVSWRAPGPVTLDWTGSAVGPMRLPRYEAPFERPTRSEPYAVHGLQATWTPAPGREIRLGVKNVLDFTQGSPLVDPGNPFGDAFDTNYVWGPISGRKLVLGVRLAEGR